MVREAILLAIHKDIRRIIIQSNSQIVVNTINDNISMLKDIVNSVKDIKKFLVPSGGSRIEYCHRGINYEVDRLAKMTLM